MMLQNLISQNARSKSIIVVAILLLALVGVACTQTQPEPEPQPDEQSQVEQNKEIAVAFLTMIFNEHKVKEAFDQYSVPDYIQHNPFAASGAEAAINFLGPYLEANPEAHTDIKRVIAEGDLVAIHNNPKMNATDRGRAVVDIFRIENGRAVEHWDVVQDIPEQSANDNTMF
ncbi:MAG: nuclear transport factor 2 family protein [Acidobacteriota bacterium]|jgi:predicted SnoaL-like aldol condensation-catalyzing enzyme